MQLRIKTIFATIVFTIGSIEALAWGSSALLGYGNTPDSIGDVPQSWPVSQIPPAAERATLVMLAHPHGLAAPWLIAGISGGAHIV